MLAKHFKEQGVTGISTILSGNSFGYCMFGFKRHDDTEDFLCTVQCLNMGYREPPK
jgi:hypothetical protein